MNEVNLIGRLAADPKMYETSTKILTFTIAYEDRYKKDEEWKTHVNWIDIVCFGSLAERNISKIAKGDLVAITGSLRSEQFEDSLGNKRKSIKVTARNIKNLNYMKKAHSDELTQESHVTKSYNDEKVVTNNYYDDDDIPF